MEPYRVSQGRSAGLPRILPNSETYGLNRGRSAMPEHLYEQT